MFAFCLPTLCVAAEAPELKTFTLWQLKEQTRTQMMSYVIRTQTGKVIVIDGGTAGDAKHLAEHIAGLGNHVSLWILTHPHSDHTDALVSILQAPGEMRIDGIYASMPEREWVKTYANAEEWRVYERTCAVFEKTGRAPAELELGQEFLIDGVRIEILGIKNPEITANSINNQSVILKVTGADRSILFTGDLGREGGRKALAGPYADRLHADYIQMAHHGQNGVEEAFYQHVGANVCLWPTPIWLWNNDTGAGKGSGPWKTLEVRAWMEKLPIKRHYVTCLDGELIE